MGIFENRVYRNRELFSATIALIEALASMALCAFLLLQLGRFANDAALWTNRTILPENAFQVFTCFILILKLRLEDSRHVSIMRPNLCFVKCIIRKTIGTISSLGFCRFPVTYL